jgi:hypothetical protein
MGPPERVGITIFMSKKLHLFDEGMLIFTETGPDKGPAVLKRLAAMRMIAAAAEAGKQENPD